MVKRSVFEELHGLDESFAVGLNDIDFCLRAGIQALSQIPSREELLGKLLGSIQSPITNFARVLNQIAEQKGGEAEAPAAE